MGRAPQETAPIYRNSLLPIQVEYIDRGRIPEGSPFPDERPEMSDEDVLNWHDEQRSRFNTGLKEDIFDRFRDNHTE